MPIKPMIKMHKWRHPDWNGSLIADVELPRESVIQDYLADCDGGDPTLLTVEVVEMTQRQVDALPEFEGF